jgi:hypothetical protein
LIAARNVPELVETLRADAERLRAHHFPSIAANLDAAAGALLEHRAALTRLVAACREAPRRESGVRS